MNVGFIGLGLMGNPMAKNILKSGFPLTVYNKTPSKVEEFRKLGSGVAQSPKDLALKSDVIVTMVTAGEDVEKILFGEGGIVESGKEGLIIVDMSTIGPTYAKIFSKKLKSFGISFLDAPVTGSTPKAITGELNILVGGESEVYEKAKEVLSAMGKNIYYVGESGMGQAVKMINNHMVAASAIALAEGMILADDMGLQKSKAAEFLQDMPAISATMKMIIGNYGEDNYPLKFSIANLAKDTELALGEAKDKNKLRSLSLSKELYTDAVARGLENEDFSAIIKLLEK